MTGPFCKAILASNPDPSGGGGRGSTIYGHMGICLYPFSAKIPELG